jgi:hypothetical protein
MERRYHWLAAAVARLRTAATSLRVIALLTVVEVSIRWVPLPRLARVLGVEVNLRPSVSSGLPPDVSGLSAHQRRQLRCTWRIADAWPFGSGPCLRRSLVAARLLRGSGAAVRLGLPRPDVGAAHAWVEIDGRPIEDVSAYRPFVNPPASAG